MASREPLPAHPVSQRSHPLGEPGDIVERFHQEYFRTRFRYDPRREPVWREVAAYIQRRFIPASSRILDLGAGYCSFINNVVGAERHAVDIFKSFGEFAAPGVDTHLRDCTDLSNFDDASLDIVFASNLFEHLSLEELLSTLEETLRILQPGGRIILLQPNFSYCYRTYFDDYTHRQVFTHNGIYDLLEIAGFKVRRIFPRFLPVNMKSTLKLSVPFLEFWVWLYLRLPYKPLAGQMLVIADKA